MSDYHVHIPSAFELSAAIAGPIVVEHGRGRLPYDVYLHVIQLYAILHGGECRRWFSNTWLYYAILRKQPITWHIIDRFQLACTADVISLCDHMVVSHKQSKLNHNMMVNLCHCVDETDKVIACIHRLAKRVTNPHNLDILLSMGLMQSPVKPIREALMQHGARLYPVRSYIYSAAGNGLTAKVRENLDVEGHYIIPDRMLMEATRSGDAKLVNIVFRDILARPSNYNGELTKKGVIDCVFEAVRRSHYAICELPQFSWVLTKLQHLWRTIKNVESAKWLLKYQVPTECGIGNVMLFGQLDVVMYLVEQVHVKYESDLLVSIPSSMTIGGEYPDIGLIDYVLCHGTDINARDDNGNTLLLKMPLYARYFIDKGADVHVKNKRNETLQDKLAERKRMQILTEQDDLLHPNGTKGNDDDDEDIEN